MSPRQTLASANTVFLDTAPVIYFTEANPKYLPILEPVFRRMDETTLIAAVSAVTLAECIVHPLQNGNQELVATFVELLTNGPGLRFMQLDEQCAKLAARLRAAHGFTLTDAFQLASASIAECDVFLTNDAKLKRVSTPAVVVLDDVLAEVAT